MKPFAPLNENKARYELVEVAKLAYERRYLVGTEGNLSIRLDAQRVLTTPRGTCKARLSPSDLVVTNLDGQLLPESKYQSKLPSTELKMHLVAYQQRDDIRAIVHAHPTTAVAFTVAGQRFDAPILPESILNLGAIPVAPYATPSTEEVPESIKDLVKSGNCLLLDHHGSLTFGATIFDAFYLLETLEHQAQTLMTARLLGGEKPLDREQIEKLYAICQIYGLKPPSQKTNK